MGAIEKGKNIVPLRIPLRDQGMVFLREVRHSDRPHFVDGFAQLSRQSLYYRFHTHGFKLHANHLAYFTEVDQVNHVALVVGAGTDPDGGPGMGVGRYMRLPDCPDEAEIALTVLDAYQRQGIGTVLLAALSYCAALNDIRVFRMHVQAERRGLIRVLQQLTATPTTCRHGIMELAWTIPNHFQVPSPHSATAQWYQRVGQYILAQQRPASA